MGWTVGRVTAMSANMPRSRNKKTGKSSKTQPVSKRRVNVQRPRPLISPVPRGMRYSALQYFDANASAHLPLPGRVAPYAVQRIVHNIPINASATDFTFVVIGPLNFDNGVSPFTKFCASDIIALSGTSTTLLSAANIHKSADLTTLGNLGSVNLTPAEVTVSALSVNLLCTSNFNVGSGQVWIGRSPSPVDIINPASVSFANHFGSFLGRPGVMPKSYFELFNPVNCHSVPMDLVQYQMFRPIIASGSTTPTSLDFDHGMCPLVLMFSPAPVTVVGITPTSYNIRIAMELRVRYPIISPNSTLNLSHPPSSQGFFDAMVEEMEGLVGGVIAASALNRFGPMARLVGQGQAGFGRVGRGMIANGVV